VQLVDLRAGEQRRVDLEVGVLGRRPDQLHDAVLDGGQQRVLLRLVEAVDLVEEEDRRAGWVGSFALRGAGDHLAHLGPPRVDGRELLERRARMLGREPRERRLAGARRPVEDHRVRLTGLERRAQRRALAEEVLLPDELVEPPGAHARGQRSVDHLLEGGFVFGRLEQTLHNGEVWSVKSACPECSLSISSRVRVDSTPETGGLCCVRQRLRPRAKR
jgi:hypothetical protein